MVPFLNFPGCNAREPELTKPKEYSDILNCANFILIAG
jgi:hypothetical protein